MKIKSDIITHWPVIVYLLIFSFLFSLKILQHPFPFFDWDESIYAQVGREMIQNHSFVPLWQGQHWLDKPPLVPLFYGLVATLTPLLVPEISTRLTTLFLSVVCLFFIYKLYYKVTKDVWLTTLVVILTSLSSIFLQRAQVLNVDIFLLLGWLGYVLYYRKFWVSTIFLSFAVYSKSLIGFFPVGMMGLFFLYQFVFKKINWKTFQSEIVKLTTQICILSLWYIGMYLFFGNNFLFEHFYESHIKRVTASIESHFGQRTFYIDLLYIEYGKYIFASAVGIVFLIVRWVKKSISDKSLFYAFFLLPWFVFLNLTKTKIFWYGHPYIPQFAFLMVYPISMFRKARLLSFVIIIICIFSVMQNYFIKNTVLDDFYSSNDPHHVIAKSANNTCSQLYVVVEPETRQAFDTLSKMNLLITTSKWWGNHPSMVYYFRGNVSFIYTIAELDLIVKKGQPKNCLVINSADEEAMQRTKDFIFKAYEKPLLLFIHK